MVGMAVAQGQDIDLVKIKAPLQHGPQGAGAQVQEQEAARRPNCYRGRAPPQGGHPRTGADDYQFQVWLFSYNSGKIFASQASQSGLKGKKEERRKKDGAPGAFPFTHFNLFPI